MYDEHRVLNQLVTNGQQDILYSIADMFQAILFDRSEHDTRSARSWLRRHRYQPIKRVHITPNWLRYRLADPADGVVYRTIRLGNHIMAVTEISGNSGYEL